MNDYKGLKIVCKKRTWYPVMNNVVDEIAYCTASWDSFRISSNKALVPEVLYLDVSLDIYTLALQQIVIGSMAFPEKKHRT